MQDQEYLNRREAQRQKQARRVSLQLKIDDLDSEINRSYEITRELESKRAALEVEFETNEE